MQRKVWGEVGEHTQQEAKNIVEVVATFITMNFGVGDADIRFVVDELLSSHLFLVLSRGVVL
jgi:hypothetical protein